MPVNYNVFLHESDKAALDALKSIPGFSQFTKAFMNGWNEKLMYIDNMATNVRISEKQLPEYRQMLDPICEKLGIEVPDLFLKLDVNPNAWTYGDTKPYIVITSGLLETIPHELIPTVLAHECGHIACHHVLYRTMGQILLSGAAGFLGTGLGNLALLPIKAAFAYWMRCSEFSADRAAMLCGKPENVIEMCMRFAGFDKNIPYEMNVDAFMEQAEEYHRMTTDDKWNKTLASVMYSMNSHPINAVRAYECRKWAESDEYAKALRYFEAYRTNTQMDEFPLPFAARQFAGRPYKDVEKEIWDAGLTNIIYERITERSPFMKNGTVISVSVDSRMDYAEGDWVTSDTPVCITYYSPLSEEELSQQITLRNGLSRYYGMDVMETEQDFRDMGFENIVTEPLKDITDPADDKLNRVFLVTIDRNMQFASGDSVSKDAHIRIVYHELKGAAE